MRESSSSIRREAFTWDSRYFLWYAIRQHSTTKKYILVVRSYGSNLTIIMSEQIPWKVFINELQHYDFSIYRKGKKESSRLDDKLHMYEVRSAVSEALMILDGFICRNLQNQTQISTKQNNLKSWKEISHREAIEK